MHPCGWSRLWLCNARQLVEQQFHSCPGVVLQLIIRKLACHCDAFIAKLFVILPLLSWSSLLCLLSVLHHLLSGSWHDSLWIQGLGLELWIFLASRLAEWRGSKFQSLRLTSCTAMYATDVGSSSSRSAISRSSCCCTTTTITTMYSITSWTWHRPCHHQHDHRQHSSSSSALFTSSQQRPTVLGLQQRGAQCCFLEAVVGRQAVLHLAEDGPNSNRRIQLWGVSGLPDSKDSAASSSSATTSLSFILRGRF